MSRAAQAIVNLSALRHNLQEARQAAPFSEVVAVVKANGYGHGMVRVARAFSDADRYAVACMEEALVLRDAAIAKPIVLLEGMTTAAELPVIQQQGLEMVVHHEFQLDILCKSRGLDSRAPISVWLKIDTGMHRLGFAPEQARAVWHELRAHPAIGPIALMTHLANADDLQDPYTNLQVERFSDCARGIDAPLSIANSAGLLGWPQTRADIVRPGIMLYGSTPFNTGDGKALNLEPAMTLQTVLIAVNTVRKGEAVGYGGQWTCPEDMPVGVAAIGYGDGYPRHAVSGTPVLVNGQRAQLIGRVSMDMICVDLRGVPEAKVGDRVVAWGEGLPIEEVAQHAGTISYELMCGVTQRVSVLETP